MKACPSIHRRFNIPQACGFTYVEIMIVVVIIGILAAVVVPEFSHPPLRKWREVALQINLNEFRGAILLYEAQHGHYPAAMGDGCCPSMSETCFFHQLFGPTNRDGLSTPTSGRSLGPYLMGSIPECPVGPRLGESSIEIVDSLSKIAGSSKPSAAWKYNVQTGEFICNLTKLSLGGLAYCQF